MLGCSGSGVKARVGEGVAAGCVAGCQEREGSLREGEKRVKR